MMWFCMRPRIRAALNVRAAALLAAVAASEQLLAALSAALPRSTASSIACATSRWLAALKGIAVDAALDSVSLLLSETKDAAFAGRGVRSLLLSETTDGMDAGRDGVRAGGKSGGDDAAACAETCPSTARVPSLAPWAWPGGNG